MKQLFIILLLAASFSAIAQTTVKVPLNAKITKVASGSTIVSTIWSFESGTGGVIENTSSIPTNATLPAGSFLIKLTVKDNIGNTVYKTTRINVIDNRAPIIEITPADTTIYLGSTSLTLVHPIYELSKEELEKYQLAQMDRMKMLLDKFKKDE